MSKTNADSRFHLRGAGEARATNGDRRLGGNDVHDRREASNLAAQRLPYEGTDGPPPSSSRGEPPYDKSEAPTLRAVRAAAVAVDRSEAETVRPPSLLGPLSPDKAEAETVRPPPTPKAPQVTLTSGVRVRPAQEQVVVNRKADPRSGDSD